MVGKTRKGKGDKDTLEVVERPDVVGEQEPSEVAEVEEVATPSPKGAPSREPFYVNADTPFEKVVEADRSGKRLVFDMDLLPTYSTEERAALSDVTRGVYESVEQSVIERGRREISEEEVLQRITAEGTHDYATARLEVRNANPAYDYIWPYPDNVQRLRESGFWEVVSGSGEHTAGNPDGSRGMHIIGKRGSAEHILMRRKKSVTEMFNKRREEQFAKAAGLVETEFREGMEREGVPTFTKDDAIARRAQFTDTAVGRVREG